MTACEEVSRLFEFELDVLSENHDLRLEDLLGQNMTVRFVLPEGDTRYFNGIVAHFRYVGTQHRFAHYAITLQPWLWFLTRSSDCRIFQHKTVPEIIKQIFEDHGFTDFEERYSAGYQARDYCVQYRESDFDFCSRLMEHEGIFYYFKHENSKHTLVLGDDSTRTNESVPNYDEIPYYPQTEGAHRERDHIYEVSLGCQVQPGRYTLRDFDFTKPKANLEARRSDPQEHQRAELEVYDYPGSYVEADRGSDVVGMRLEELHTGYSELSGCGDIGGLMPGAVFTLTNCTREEQNAEFFTVRTVLRLQVDGYESEAGSAKGWQCTCSFTAIDSAMLFRPARTTPKPFVHGPQTAMVVGPGGEEIHTDQYGRVKCQFHWDREGEQDENSSCWIRVSHPWAGKNWGAVSIPRIGQEVIIDFLEGDPDQPIVTGRVYNADTMPPFNLPDQAMVSGIKSNSTKGGGGYNEFVMDDTKGKELVRQHAQYNMDTTVQNDQSVTLVSGNRTVTVQSGTQSETIKGDASVTVQAGSRTVSVTGGNYSATASDAVVLHGKSQGVGITGDSKGVGITGTGEGVGILGTGQGVGITGKGDGVGILGEPDIFAEGTSNITLKSPTVDIGDQEVNISGSKIVISAGGGSITIDAAGVTVQGTLLKLN